MRNAQTSDCGDLAQRKVFTQVVFNERQHLFEPPAGKTSLEADWRARERTMIAHKLGCQRRAQAVEKEAAAWISAFHLCLQSPANVFDLRVPYLKAVPDLDVTRIDVRLFG